MTYDALDLNDFLLQFQPLVYKTLNRLNIRSTHMDYDDYFQELQIHLLKIREKSIEAEKSHEKLEANDEKRLAMFIAFATKGLYWHGINMLNKKNKQVFSCTEDEDLEFLSQSADAFELHQEVYLDDFFTQAKKRLSTEDYTLLLYLSDGKYSIRDIAKRMGVSVSVIYERRERIQGRLAGIKKCLTD